MTCDTCKYWAEKVDGMAYWGSELRECSSEKITYGDARGRRDANDSLVVSQDEAAYIGIHTGPKFGCIHWKANEPPLEH